MNRAEILANMLASEADEWLLLNPADSPGSSKSLYAFPLPEPPVIDGYDEDWLEFKSQSERFSARSAVNQAVAFDWLAGFYDQSLYLLIEVYDEQLVYPRNERQIKAGDHLILAIPGSEGKTRRFLLGTPSPGWVNVQEVGGNTTQSRIFGEWQETGSGYRVELSIPRTLIKGRLSLVAVDIDQFEQQPVGIASTSGWLNDHSLAYLTLPTAKAEQWLEGMESQRHRYTLLNRERQVVGRHGTIAALSNDGDSLPQRLASLLLMESPEEHFEKREKLGRLDGPEIRKALSGEGAVYRYNAPGTELIMLSSAYPIRVDGSIQGVLIVEQSTQEILLLQQSAIEDLLLISLGLFIITGGSLLLLASSLTSRITRLSRKYQQSVSRDGRILMALTATDERDELGQLDVSLSAVLKRTKDYSHYLESMASRLAHEFRTPLTVIQSSLENLQAEIESDPHSGSNHSTALTYAMRAQEGTRRLNQILTRLREATRLEQALNDTELVKTDLTALLSALCQGYADSYQKALFEAKLPDRPIITHISPDLISQALDKMISNAVDYHRPDTPICIELDIRSGGLVTLKVINQGPLLDEAIQQNMFNSMSSQRPSSHRQDPHLGLGLYLVRLISEFHQGRAWAENLGDGVCIAIELPLQ